MGFRVPVPQQSLGATGFNPAFVRYERLTLVLVVKSGAACTVTWDSEDGRGSSWVIPVGGAFKLDDTWGPKTLLTGVGAVIQGAWCYPGTDLNPETLFISNTLTTDMGTTNPNPLALEAGGNLATVASRLATIITLLGAGLPSTLSAGGGVKVHDVGS